MGIVCIERNFDKRPEVKKRLPEFAINIPLDWGQRCGRFILSYLYPYFIDIDTVLKEYFNL